MVVGVAVCHKSPASRSGPEPFRHIRDLAEILQPGAVFCQLALFEAKRIGVIFAQALLSARSISVFGYLKSNNAIFSV